ncbi:MAG: dihydrolipoyl dehydrogenase [Sedimentisphaerales bacterium]|nr:dihydrolipoyl dehydrogenase [Sedimentisphaerales bacterium]
MSDKFDVAVIGTGPGGYTAAIRCAQNGASVAIIEKGDIGGTCLNVGCIPSKALLASAHLLVLAKNAEALGVEIDNAKINWQKAQERKDAIIAGFRKGMARALQSRKIKMFEGTGIITAKNKITAGDTQIKASKIIIATGSVPFEIDSVPFDGEKVISSTEALSFSRVPESMVIIGGGAIGCEMSCIYAAVGSKVTIVEALDSILPFEDEWVGRLLAREFYKLGIDIIAGDKVTACDKSGEKVKLSLEDGDSIEAEKVLVSVGRKAFCDSQTIEALSLEMNGGAIKVNEKMETNIKGIYAVGDAAGKTYLAHGAFMEAEVAAGNATGKQMSMPDYSLVPRVVYTFCEVASVGRGEKQCKQEGVDCTIGKAFFRANGRSVGHNETVGEVRVVRDKETNKVVGVTMVGAGATEMIAAGRALLGSDEKIEKISFAHPTVSEVLKEAWENAFDQAPG